MGPIFGNLLRMVLSWVCKDSELGDHRIQETIGSTLDPRIHSMDPKLESLYTDNIPYINLRHIPATPQRQERGG